MYNIKLLIILLVMLISIKKVTNLTPVKDLSIKEWFSYVTKTLEVSLKNKSKDLTQGISQLEDVVSKKLVSKTLLSNTYICIFECILIYTNAQIRSIFFS